MEAFEIKYPWSELFLVVLVHSMTVVGTRKKEPGKRMRDMDLMKWEVEPGMGRERCELQ